MILSMSLISIALTSLIYVFYNYYEVREVPMLLEVKKGVLGFNTNKELNFGKIMPGDMGRKWVEISSEKRARLTMESEGELARWVEISPSETVLEPGEKKTISFTIMLPDDAPEGIYKGKVKFYFKRVSG